MGWACGPLCTPTAQSLGGPTGAPKVTREQGLVLLCACFPSAGGALRSKFGSEFQFRVFHQTPPPSHTPPSFFIPHPPLRSLPASPPRAPPGSIIITTSSSPTKPTPPTLGSFRSARAPISRAFTSDWFVIPHPPSLSLSLTSPHPLSAPLDSSRSQREGGYRQR